MKDFVSLCSQKSTVIYNTDLSIFCMSQFELVLQCPSGSLEHFCARAFVRVWVPVSAMQNKTHYERILKPPVLVLGLPVLTSL